MRTPIRFAADEQTTPRSTQSRPGPHPDVYRGRVRVLVTTNAAMGHFLPLVPTVLALVGAGHEVRVACPAPFAAVVDQTGLDVIACDEQSPDVAIPTAPAADDRDGRLTWAITTGWPWDARTWLTDLLARAREWGPDVVVVEPMEHAGRIVAAVLGVPVVEHGWGFSLPAGLTHLGTLTLRDLYSAAGARPRRPALSVDLGPANLQHRDAASVPRYRYRPCSLPGPGLPSPDGRPRVLVTLGTYAHPEARQRMRVIVAAALENESQVTAVLGHSDRGSRADFAPDVTVVDWIDLTAAVASYDLVAHHGGAGTSWATVLAGRAALVVPQAADQFRNAALLERAGAARVIDTRDCEVTTVSRALRGLLNDPAYGAHARDIAAANAELPDPGALATAIVRSAHRRA